jgi:molybdopterin-dependent oxidoreductase alpha subunit
MSKEQTEAPTKPVVGGGFKAIEYVMSCANKVGPGRLAAAVKSRNACKACAFGTGGQRGGLHNEHSNRVEICNKNIQAQLSDIREPIPPEIFTHNSIAELQALTGKQLEDLGRLGQPLHKAPGASHYRPISYEKAIQLIAERMKAATAPRSFFYASGRSSNEAAFLLQLLARVYGSNHVNNCSFYCHQASGVGLKASIGTGTATIQYADLHQADLILVLGANPASNHPRFVKTLIECRQRGGQVIVVNPVREAGLVRFASPSNFRSMISGGSEVASLYVQPSVGGDAAFLSGVAKAVLAGTAQDDRFIEKYCNGYDEYRDFLLGLAWQDLEAQAGVSRQTMEQVATVYAGAEKTVFAWGMGLTHHKHGTENIEAVSNLALLRGMIGAPGSGLLPLRGHSNVQGVGSMGFTPALKTQVFEAMQQQLGIQLPSAPGLDTLACLQAASRGEMDFAFLLGGNLYAATPDSRFAEQALAQIPFKVMLSTTLNQTHVFGVEQENIILPVRARDEEKQPTSQESMFNFVRLSDGGFDRIPALWSEVEIIGRLACQVVPETTLDFSQFLKHQTIRQAIARLVPGFDTLAEIDDSKQEFHIPGRHLEEPLFPTPDGRASFRLPLQWPTRLPKRGQDSDPHRFTLTTVRSEGQFNTIIFNEKDVYRRQTHRHVLFMNPRDMERLGIAEGDTVDMGNETGEMAALVATAFAIHEGDVMTYFPEANVLISQSTDARSCTPAFKSVPVRVRRSAQSEEAC